jgi:hypothetical protein
MIRVIRICRKCGAKILSDAPADLIRCFGRKGMRMEELVVLVGMQLKKEFFKLRTQIRDKLPKF